MRKLTVLLLGILFMLSQNKAIANDGYGLWLNYFPVSQSLQKDYQNQIKSLIIVGNNPTLEIAKTELSTGLNRMLGTQIS